MRRLLLGTLFLALVPVPGSAQTSREHKGHGYVFVAPGGVSGGCSTLHFGGGGEALVWKGLGVGAEIGYLSPARSLADGFGLLSLNGSYHFSNRQSPRKLVPFVTAGYSLAFREEVANLFNVGGGVNYWFRERLGLRLEVRDHVWTHPAEHFWGFRIGLTFR